MIQPQTQFDVDPQVLLEEVKKLRESNEKVRKSLFAKHGEISKNYFDLLTRMEILEQNICQNTKPKQ